MAAAGGMPAAMPAFAHAAQRSHQQSQLLQRAQRHRGQQVRATRQRIELGEERRAVHGAVGVADADMNESAGCLLQVVREILAT